MTSPDVELRATWHHVAGHGHDLTLEALLGRLREPHRRYHTATHVMWVVRHVDRIAREGPVDAIDLDAVRLAALYHDAVYDPRRNDNEAVSADLAAGVAGGLGWSAPRVATVHRLVLATAGHAPAAADEAVLVDADLAILGADPGDYAAYVRGVRAEYAHVDDAQWRTGRTAVLRAFAAQEVLFHTAVMRGAFESRARANLAAELAALC